MRVRIGIDTGGTFTDVVAVDEESGGVTATKTPSTPQDPSIGFLQGIDKVLGILGAGPEAVSAVSHGTTVATNALLSDEMSGLGLLTTRGFKHVLEIARQSVPDGYGNSYFWVKPDRIVPLHLVQEVPERLDHTGAVIRELDEDAVAASARWFEAQGVGAVAVSLLHSYANPAHEQRVRDVFARVYPGCSVSISSDVLREYREYERAVTTCVDAFVKPKVAAYIEGIDAALRQRAGSAPFSVMKSNGGISSAREVAAQPITTVLSGPAAGALGAAMIANAAGHERVLTLDAGGTSTDVSVVRGGQLTLTTEGSVGRFPTKVPMVDIATVGTGGGSIAWVSPEGGLKVGPRSAGADPGPISYGRGGTDPTVTDAHLILGRIPPALLGGEVPLDSGPAQAGIDKLAAAVGLDAEHCAAGVLEIAAWNQANAIRQVTVRRGLDVRDFVLAAFGGSGPLLACRLLELLGLPAALIPQRPGNVSAFGLLTVDVRNDYVQTFVARHGDIHLGRLAGAYAELEAQAAEALRREGFAEADQQFVRSADLRYYGQAFEVRAAAPAGSVDSSFCEAVLSAFHDEHARLYGYAYRDRPDQVVEWVNLRVSGIGPIATPALAPLETGDGDPSAARTGSRPVYFDRHWHDTPLYDRDRLRAGDEITGPAVVEEFGSTLPIAPGFAAHVDKVANIVVTKS